ncbi:MAG TPA: hypothetical protein VFT76_01585 [Actinomycetota bacterium]|nr:hypothetical protein [Actinomycetota bacterium]
MLATDVAAFGLGRFQRGHESVGEVTRGHLERDGHRIPHRVSAHHVRLAREAVADPVAGFGDAAFARVNGDAAVRVEDGHLPVRTLLVHRHSFRERLGGALPRTHQIERERTVFDQRRCLRGDRTDARLRPTHDARREPVRLHGDAEVAPVRIASDDRVRHRVT